MIAFEFAALFTLAALLALGSLTATVRTARPLVRNLKAELSACPDKLELRYTIVETVVRWNDGTVVALPVRQRPVRLPLATGLRAAA